MLSFIDKAKKKVDGPPAAVRDEAAAHREKGESDVAGDPQVAGARDGDDGADGEYVGRTTPVFDAEVQQSGAAPRSEEARGSG